MHITNNTGLPQPLYDMVKEGRYDNGGADASVTELLLPPRVRILQRQNDEFIVKDAAMMLQAALGTTLHEAMSTDKTDGVICEERLSCTVNGWKISGGIDRQITEEDGTVTIEDFKVTGAGKVSRVIALASSRRGLFDEDWAKQLNMYAYLVENNKKVKVSGLRIIAVIRDWSAIKAEVIADYPKAPVVTLNMPLMNHAKRGLMMRELVLKHQEAENAFAFSGKLPECTDREMWVDEKVEGERFRGVADEVGTGRRAVIIRASKDEGAVFSSLKIKERQHKGVKVVSFDRHRVELVKPERLRCKYYCDAAPFCDQWADHNTEKEAYEIMSHIRLQTM